MCKFISQKEQLETELEKLGKVNKGKDLKLSRVLQESGALKTSKDEEISELNTKLAEMTAHMDDINSQKDELLCDNERLRFTIDNIKAENNELKLLMESISKEKEVCLTENKDLKNEQNKLQKLYKGREAKMKKFQDVVSEQEKMLATKEADIIMLRENVAQLENKLHDINYDEEFLQSEISKLETDNSKLQQNYEQYEIDNRHLEMRCQQLEEELFSVQTDNRLKLDRDEGQKQEQILYLEQYVESLQRSVSEKEKLRIDLENELLALRDREQLWLQEKEKLETEISKLQQICKAKEAKVNKITQESEDILMSKDSVIEKLNYDLDESKFKNEEIEKQLKFVNSEKDEINAELQKIQKLYKGKDVKNRKFEEVVSEQERIMTDKEAENVMLKERVKGLEHRMEDVLYEEELTRKEFEILRNENLDLKDRCYWLEEEIGTIQKDMTEKLDESQNELQRICAEKEDIYASKQLFEETVENLEYDKETLTNVIGERENGISEINDELQQAMSACDKLMAENKKLSALLKGKDVKIKKLEEKCKEDESVIIDLNKNIENVEEEREKFVNEIGKLQKLGKGRDVKAKKFEEVVAVQEKVLVDKDTEVVILKEQINELNCRLEDLFSEEQGLRDELNESVTTVQQLEEKCHHLAADIEQLISNIKEKDNQIEELKQNLDINHELILKLESEKNNLMLEKEKMEHSVTEIHQEVSDRDINVDKVRKELESVLVEKEQLTLEIAKLKKVGKGRAAKVAKFEKVVSQQENIISEKEMDMIVLKERVQHLTEKLEYSDQELALLSNDLEQALLWKDKYDILLQDISQSEKIMKESISPEQQTPSVVEENIVQETFHRQEASTQLQTTGHFLDVNDEIENLRLQLQEEKDKFVKEKSSLDGQIKKLKTLCKAKDTKLSKLMSDTGSPSSESSQMSVLESEIHFLKTDADTLKEVLLTKSKELEMSENMCKDYELKLKELSHTLENLQTENDAKKEEIQTLSGNMLAWEQWYKTELENQKMDAEKCKNDEISSLQSTWSSYETWYRQEISNLQGHVNNQLTGVKSGPLLTIDENVESEYLQGSMNASKCEMESNDTKKSDQDVPSLQTKVDEDQSETTLVETSDEKPMLATSENEKLQNNLLLKDKEISDLRNELVNLKDNQIIVNEMQIKIEKLQNEISSRESEFQSLKEMFENDIDEFQSNLDATKEEKTKLNQILEDKNQEILTLRTENASQGVWDHVQIGSMETELEEYESASKWYKSRVEELENNIAYLEGLNSSFEIGTLEMERKCEQLQDMMEQSEKECEELRNESNLMRHNNDLYNDMLEKSKIEKENIQLENEKSLKSKDSKIKTMIEAIDDLQDMLSKKEFDLQRLVTEKEAKSEENSHLENTVRYLQEQLSTETLNIQLSLLELLKDQLGASVDDTEVHQHDYDSTCTLLTKIKIEILNLKQSQAETLTKYGESEENIKSLEKELKNLTDIIDQEKEKSKTFEIMVNNYELKLEEKEQIMTDLKQKLSSSVTNQGDITEKDSQICQLESQLARLKDNLSRQGMEMQDLQQLYQNECEQLEQALNALEDCKKSFSSKLEESEIAVANLRERLQSTESANEKLECLLKDKDDYIILIESQKRDNVEKANELEGHIEEKDAEIKSLSESFDSIQKDLVKRIEEMKNLQKMYESQSEEQDKMLNTIEEFNTSNAIKLQEKETKITELMQELYGKQALMEATEASKMSFVKSLQQSEETILEMMDKMEAKEKYVNELKLQLRKQEEKVNMLEDNVDRLSLENNTLVHQLRQLEMSSTSDGHSGKNVRKHRICLYLEALFIASGKNMYLLCAGTNFTISL